MPEIKTLAEMHECCAVCDLMSGRPWICSVDYDYVLPDHWCKYFEQSVHEIDGEIDQHGKN
jgi:hypothetical protein